MSDDQVQEMVHEPMTAMPPVVPPTIGRLALALAKAQGEIKGAARDAENPAFKRGDTVSKYADLEAVWTACRDALSKNNLAVFQTTHRSGGDWVLRTTLAHESGEAMSGDFPVRPLKPDMQGFMAAVTYARRGGLASMVGVAPKGEDDDGNAASGVKSGPTKDTGPPPQLAAKKSADKPLSKEQIAWVDKTCKELEQASVNQVLDWEITNQDALDKLKAHNTTAWNRVTQIIVDRTADPETGERQANG